MQRILRLSNSLLLGVLLISKGLMAQQDSLFIKKGSSYLFHSIDLLQDDPTPDIYIPQRVHWCIRDTTKFYLHALDNAGPVKSLSRYHTDLNARALYEKLQAISVNAGEQRGFVVHYGMDNCGAQGSMRMRFALELVVLEPAGDHWLGKYFRSRPVPAGFYSDDLQPVDKQTWLANYALMYRSNIRIRRTNKNKNYTSFIKDQDVESYTFFHEQAFAKLISDNLKIDKLRIYAMAEPTLRERLPDGTYEETGWRQIIALIGVDAQNSELITNVDHGPGSFRDKGLDLGSPCPPLCKGAVYQAKGMAIHPACP